MIEVKVKINLKNGILDPIGMSLEKRIKKDYQIDVFNFKVGKYIQFNIDNTKDINNFLSQEKEEKNNIAIKRFKKKLKFLIKNILSNSLIEDCHLKIKSNIQKKVHD